MKENEVPVFSDFDNTGWDVFIKKGKYFILKKGDVEIKIKKDGEVIINNWPDDKSNNRFSVQELKDIDRLINIFQKAIKDNFNEVGNPKGPEVKNPIGPNATPETPMEFIQPKGPDGTIKEVVEHDFNPPPSEYNIKIHQHGRGGAYVKDPKGPNANHKEVVETRDPSELNDYLPKLPDNEMGPEIPVECPDRKRYDEDENDGPEMC